MPTINHLQTIKKTTKYNSRLPLFLVFVDYGKVFGNGKVEGFKIGLSYTSTKLIKDIYMNATFIVMLQEGTNPIKISKETRQGNYTHISEIIYDSAGRYISKIGLEEKKDEYK